MYYYFGSKYGLLEALVNEKLSNLNTAMRQAADYHGNVPGTLYRMASQLIDLANENRKMYVLMMALYYSAKENEAYRATRPLITELYGIIVRFFEDATPQLGNIRGRQEQFAMGFLGILNQYILWMCEKTEEGCVVEEEKKHSLVNQFMYGIFYLKYRLTWSMAMSKWYNEGSLLSYLSVGIDGCTKGESGTWGCPQDA